MFDRDPLTNKMLGGILFFLVLSLGVFCYILP